MKTIFYQKYLDSAGEEKIGLSIGVNKGKEINIVVQYERFIGDKWCAIVRYDCSDGFFHRDLLFPRGEKEKQIISIPTLEEALNFAELDLKDRREIYTNNYKKKLIK